MRQKIFLSLWAITLLWWLGAASAGAQEPSFLTLRLSSSQSVYRPIDTFNMNLFMSNSLPTAVKAGVVFELHGRSGLTADTDTPVIFRRAWSRYNFPPGPSELKIGKSISSLKLTEGAYPIKVSLTQGGQVINSARSMLVVVAEHPSQQFLPLPLVLVWPLHERARFDHRGVFLDNKIAEEANTDPNNPGLYYRHFLAVSRYPGLQVTMAFAPLLAEQMRDMKNGYRLTVGDKVESKTAASKEAKDVSTVFEGLAGLFGSKQISLLPMPYSLAPLSFLAENGWKEDGRLQISRGKATLMNAFELGTEEDSFALPNFSLSAGSLTYLADEGVQNTILDESLFEKLVPGGSDDVYRAYRLQDAEGNRISAVFRDRVASAALVLDSPEEAVQRIMGRLSEIYLLQPQRQKIVVAAADFQAKPSRELLDNLYQALQVPWIKTVTLKEAVELVPAGSRPLMMPDSPVEEGYLSGEYWKRVSQSRRLYRLYAEGVEANNPLRKRLEKELLIAEGGDWTRNWDLKTVNLGLDFVGDIEKAVERELRKIKVVSGESITLSSLGGKIPISVFNRAGYPLKVSITVDGKDFSFPSGRVKKVTLQPKENLFSFSIAAAKPGAFPLKVIVWRGSEIVDQATFMVKATSLSRTIALVLGLVVLAVLLYFLVRFAVRGRNLRVGDS